MCRCKTKPPGSMACLSLNPEKSKRNRLLDRLGDPGAFTFSAAFPLGRRIPPSTLASGPPFCFYVNSLSTSPCRQRDAAAKALSTPQYLKESVSHLHLWLTRSMHVIKTHLHAHVTGQRKVGLPLL